MKEYVKQNLNGLLFQHRNSDSLYQQMEFAVANPEKMKKLGEKGYLYSENGKVPNIREHCKELERIYTRV